MIRNTWQSFAVAAFVGLIVGFTASAGPKLRPGSEYHDMVPCMYDGGTTGAAAAGTTSATITKGGSYLLTALTETVWLCVGDAGCDNSGHPLAAGMSMNMDFDSNTALSCRSTAWTGELVLTYKAPGT